MALGDRSPLILGLGNAEPVAVMGALDGARLPGVRAVIVGVVWLLLGPLVFIGFREGLRVDLSGSGRAMSSMICSISASASRACSFRLEDWRCAALDLLACLRIFISDAGVAGSPSCSTTPGL